MLNVFFSIAQVNYVVNDTMSQPHLYHCYINLSLILSDFDHLLDTEKQAILGQFWLAESAIVNIYFLLLFFSINNCIFYLVAMLSFCMIASFYPFTSLLNHFVF